MLIFFIVFLPPLGIFIFLFVLFSKGVCVVKKCIVFLLVFVLVVSLLSFSAFAVGANGDGYDFSVVLPYGSSFVMVPVGSNPASSLNSLSGSSAYYCLFILPYSLDSAGSAIIADSLFSGSQPVLEDIWILFFDSSADLVGQWGGGYLTTFSVPAGTRYISISQTMQNNYTGTVGFSVLSDNFEYYDFSYDLSSGGGADLSGITDILNAWDSGPYDVANSGTVYDFTNMSLISQNFDSVDYQTAFYTLCRSSTLMSVLSSQMWTNTSYNQDGTIAHQGFTFNRVNGASSSSQAVVSVNNLPDYLNQLGSELTSGLNKLQRDNVLIWDHVDHTYSAVQDLQSSQADLNTTLQDALYEQTDSSPSENWSVAQWLKGIFNSISGFFSSFWSDGETALKDASEGAYQEFADSGLVPSDSDVSDFASVGGSVGSMFDSGGDASLLIDVDRQTWVNSFWSDDVLEALSVPPSSSSTRGLMRSGSSTPYLDANTSEVDKFLGGGK